MTESGLPTSEHLEHLDTDTIADLIENLLPAAEAHRAREHVKACPDCQQTYDALLQLSEDLAEEGRADIPMPADVAEHLDAVIVSESVLRASTVGVHSLAQLRDEPRRYLPKLLGAAAAVVLVAAVGVGIVVATRDQAGEGAASTTQTSPPAGVVTMSTKDIGPQAQQWLEHTPTPILNGSAAEISCARQFAAGRPNPSLRLVQPVKVDGTRATLIGVQGGSPRDIQLFAVTGCSDNGVASSFYDTSVTLRNR
ncbi:zf-HC2 domain-containing protein [Kribbella sp. NPDC026611]|uniref:anti-sigma factor family protein n=1 Tax=Kribbella sp. NPDC026611 TaxID=3154911 RepID=UPI0033EAF04B